MVKPKNILSYGGDPGKKDPKEGGDPVDGMTDMMELAGIEGGTGEVGAGPIG